jgi:hypothetical protein
MAENKTQKTENSVQVFLDRIDDPQRRQDSYTVLELMRKVSGFEPKMWGEAIVGFGDQHLKYESGREMDWFLSGFSPRKQALTLYLSGGLELQSDLLPRLGKYTTGKGCIYIKKLSGVDLAVLEEMIGRSFSKGFRTD